MNNFKVSIKEQWKAATSVKDLFGNEKIYISKKNKKIFCGGKYAKLDFFIKKKDIKIHIQFFKKKEIVVISNKGFLFKRMALDKNIFINKKILRQRVEINHKLNLIKLPFLKLYIPYISKSYGNGGTLYRAVGSQRYYDFLIKKNKLIEVF